MIIDIDWNKTLYELLVLDLTLVYFGFIAFYLRNKINFFHLVTQLNVRITETNIKIKVSLWPSWCFNPFIMESVWFQFTPVRWRSGSSWSLPLCDPWWLESLLHWSGCWRRPDPYFLLRGSHDLKERQNRHKGIRSFPQARTTKYDQKWISFQGFRRPLGHGLDIAVSRSVLVVISERDVAFSHRWPSKWWR